MLPTPKAMGVNSIHLTWRLKVTRYQYAADTQITAVPTPTTSVIIGADNLCSVMFGMRIGTMDKSMPLLLNTKDMIVIVTER